MPRGRPVKIKTIRKKPPISQFSPRGRIGRPGYAGLKFEEFEAIRLSDHIGLDQKQAAKFMDISQQTFSRVLRNARKNIAKALVDGEIIKITGGLYKLEK
ncbi:MAG: DUF134 domain-containing protein [Candidatus Omnitrophica bacterium]|nr:DUF134 domain-containing protein [Candidatus Omnitrophota bacterium]